MFQLDSKELLTSAGIIGNQSLLSLLGRDNQTDIFEIGSIMFGADLCFEGNFPENTVTGFAAPLSEITSPSFADSDLPSVDYADIVSLAVL